MSLSTTFLLAGHVAVLLSFLSDNTLDRFGLIFMSLFYFFAYYTINKQERYDLILKLQKEVHNEPRKNKRLAR